MKVHYIYVLFCMFLFVKSSFSAMTEKQMKAAVKMVRNVCQPKNKVTDAQTASFRQAMNRQWQHRSAVKQIDAMHNGNWNLEKNAQCYMHCIVTMYKLLRPDNTFDWEAGIKTLEAQAPPSIGVPGIESVKNCKDSVKSSNDKCAAAYEIAKCMYLDNPENYFLP